MSLDEGDELGWVRLTSGNNDIMLVTRQGQALRIAEKSIRSMGRQGAGVSGIKLKGNDQVASMDVVEPNGKLMVVTEFGYGKRTNLEVYPVKGRATGGVATIDLKNLEKIGSIAAARVVQDEDEVTMISASGVLLRLKVKDISMSGRSTRGFRIMDLDKDDFVASVARIAFADLIKAEAKDSLTVKIKQQSQALCCLRYIIRRSNWQRDFLKNDEDKYPEYRYHQEQEECDNEALRCGHAQKFTAAAWPPFGFLRLRIQRVFFVKRGTSRVSQIIQHCAPPSSLFNRAKMYISSHDFFFLSIAKDQHQVAPGIDAFLNSYYRCFLRIFNAN